MQDPLLQFAEWFDEAAACAEIPDATAMTLATAGANGQPSARIVLLKSHGADGFTFYTNLRSHKSQQLRENPHAALCFYWIPLERQVRIEGTISLVDAAEADDYFASRGRDRQLGAWASDQSAPLASRETLMAHYRAAEAQYKDTDVPRPPHWSGWRLTPSLIEFWKSEPSRLHDRAVYNRAADGSWNHTLLNP